MIFGVIMPAFTGLANWMIPLMIGAPDMALPRINNFAFWLQPFAFALLLFSWFLPGGAPAAGWTMYAPLVLQTGAALPLARSPTEDSGFACENHRTGLVVSFWPARAS